MDYKLLTDDILSKLLRVDDEAAFKELYNRYWKLLFNEIYYRLGSKETAKELVQNLFVTLWEKRNTLVISNVKSYLQKAIKNSAINYVEHILVQKTHQQHVLSTNTDASTETEKAVLYNEFYAAFEKVLEQLPAKTRDVFKMSRFEQLSIKEIANVLNLSEKAVEYHITSSLKLLRLQLKDFAIPIMLVAVLNHI